MVRKKRAFVVGYYDMSNFGDDLFCGVIAARAEKLLPGYQVHIIRQTSPRKRNLFASTSFLGAIYRLTIGIYTVMRADLIVLGGGSVLWGVSGVRKVQWWLSKITGTQFESLGVSIGPFASPSDRADVASFLGSNNRVVVRDNSSQLLGAELAPPFEFGMGGDLASLYPLAGHRQNKNVIEERNIGLALCNFPDFGVTDVDALVGGLIRALDETSVSGVLDRVHVISLNGHPVFGDEAISERAVSLLERAGVQVDFVKYRPGRVDELWAAISSLDGLVAVRLHAAICAYLSAVPFTVLEYHQKCADFCDDVGQDDSLRVRSIPNEQESKEQILQLLNSRATPKFAPSAYVERAHSIYFGD